MIKVLKEKLVGKTPRLYSFVSYVFQAYLIKYFWLMFNKPTGVLVYVGLNTGESLSRICYRYKRCIGYEPNPVNFKICQRRFKKYNNVELYHFAASDSKGKVSLYLSDNGNNFASSSLLENTEASSIRASNIIRVKSINLGKHLNKIGAIQIDDYISDIEGHDLVVLKTLIQYLEKKRIKSVTCEVIRNGKDNPFKLCKNYECDFDEFMPYHYKKIASGWGRVKDGTFNNVPEEYKFMDVKWILLNKV